MTRTVARFVNCLAAAILILLFGFSNAVKAADVNPLRPIDASSPRATLQGFIEIMDETYRGMADLLKSYAASDRLYLSAEERKRQIELLTSGTKGIQFLDTSGISPVLRDTIAVERLLQLKEILDRIELPAFDDIPDREAMVRSSAKKWRLPGTAIDIVLIENGPRAGEYVLLGGRKPHKGSAIGLAAIHIELSEPTPVEILKVGIGPGEREVDVIEHSSLTPPACPVRRASGVQ